MISLNRTSRPVQVGKDCSLGLLLLLLTSCSQPASRTSPTAGKTGSTGGSPAATGEKGSDDSPAASGTETPANGTEDTQGKGEGVSDETSTSAPKYTLLFVGGGSARIDTYRFDKASGTATLLKSTPTPGANPTFLAIHPAKKILIAGNESGNSIMSFRIDAANGSLTLLNSQPMLGGPAHVAVDTEAKWAFAASYGNGHVASYPIAADGKLGAASSDLQAGQNAHQIVFSPTGNHIWVPCLGSNTIAHYAFSTAGQWTPLAPAALQVGSGGPRHLAVHPNGTWVYLMKELTSSVQPLTYDGSTLVLNGNAVSALSTFTGPNTGAEIAVHPNGKFLYSSNRGDDSIAIFSISDTGAISLIKTVKTGGSTPRHFALDSSGIWMSVANQNQGGVTLFKVNAETGELTPKGSRIVFESAQFAEIVDFAE